MRIVSSHHFAKNNRKREHRRGIATPTASSDIFAKEATHEEKVGAGEYVRYRHYILP